ncbi:MAG: discoidin domain-containing protein [Bacteroidota bacterium]
MIYRWCLIGFWGTILFSNGAFSQTFTLTHDSVQREYVVHVPKSYDGSAPVPLIVALHGAGGTPTSIESISGLSIKSDSSGFIVVYPKGIAYIPSFDSYGWNEDTTGLDDVGFISDMLDSLFKSYKIDTARVYVAGFSNGGGMCYRLAQALSYRIAAVAPVAPVPDYNSSNLFPSRPVPIIQFFSKNDPYYSSQYFYDMNLTPLDYWIYINGCKTKPDTILIQQNIIGEKWESQGNQAEIISYTPFSAGHTWMTAGNGISATDAMWDFFQLHTITSSSPFSAIARIDSPANGDIFQGPTNIQINADIAVVSGSVSKVEFYQNETKIGEANSAPYKFTWTSVDSGDYKITIKALDGLENVMSPIPIVAIHVLPPNVAHNKIAYSSSNQIDEGGSYSAQNAVDGKMSTRWSSLYFDPQWLCIDLGNTTSIKGVNLYWENAYGQAYKIQVSADLINWEDVYSTTTGDGGKDSISFTPISARFVRMYGTHRGTPWGYSLYEFQIDTVKTNGIKETNAGVIPKQFALKQNYPNPFNPSTTIQYSLPNAAYVTLKICNTLGQEVAQLVSQQMSAGVHSTEWNASGFASGVYYYRLEAGGFVETKKLVLLR